MPPLPGAYQANFTVNSVVYGFDILPSAYGETTEANITVRAIPWASVYTVVVQGAATVQGAAIGSKAVTRNYRVLIYTETDYLNLRNQRGQIGTLTTPREAGLQAVMTDCKRSNFQDNTTTTGPQTAEVNFVMMQ